MDKNNKFELPIINEPPESKIPIKLTMNLDKDSNITFKLPGETKTELEELAKKYNLSVSEVIRQLVKQGTEILKNAEKK
jgi:hypothetical protein